MGERITNEAERLFMKVMSRRCRNVSKSTMEEDMFQHFDVVCDEIKYEVKGDKKMSMGDDFFTDVYWIELVNVNGDPGWVKGKADYIAFKHKEEFYIIDRAELENLTEKLVKDRTVYRIKQYCKIYQRVGRKDQVTYLDFSDIRLLIKEVIKIEKQDYEGIDSNQTGNDLQEGSK